MDIKRIISLFRANSNPAGALTATDQLVPPKCDLYGNFFVIHTTATDPINGTVTPAVQTTRSWDTINNNAAATNAPDVGSFLYAHGANGQVQPLRIIADNADDQAAQTDYTLGIVSRLQAFDRLSGAYDRLSQGDTTNDTVAGIAHGALWTKNSPMLYNGATFDRQRGNVDVTILAPAVRNVTTNSPDVMLYNGGTAIFFFNITAVTAAQTVQLLVQNKDPVSGNYVTLVTGAAQGAIGTTQLVPTILGGQIISRKFRIQIVHSAGGNFTYSVGATLIGGI